MEKIANKNFTSKQKILGFQIPLRLKVSVTPHAFLVVFRNYAGEIIASRISLLPESLHRKREPSALFALAVAQRMLETEALEGYRLALIHCQALPPDGSTPNEGRLLAA